MSQNTTEEILTSLKAGNPLPDYSEMTFSAPRELIDSLARRIDSFPDTEKINKKLEKERANAKKKGIPFDETSVRAELEKTCFLSRNKFATMANINASHLTQFLNEPAKGEKKKGMSRDRLLSVFITLGMDIAEINEYLRKFDGIDTLHARIKRDYMIMVGIEKHLVLDEIDQLLREHHLDGLENFK